MNKPVERNERAAALAALSEDQRKQLAAYARFMAHRTGEEGDDLLQGAFARWLASDKPVEGPDETCKFLREAISSIRSNNFRHQKVVRRLEGERAFANEDDEDDPVDQAADSASSTEATAFAQQLYNLCTGDDDIQLLFVAQLNNGAPADIRAELGWDEKKYKAVQKRKRRLVIRWMLEGKV